MPRTKLFSYFLEFFCANLTLMLLFTVQHLKINFKLEKFLFVIELPVILREDEKLSGNLTVFNPYYAT
jgi:hypothetical protein